MPHRFVPARLLLALVALLCLAVPAHAAISVTVADIQPTDGVAFTGEVATFTDTLPTPQSLTATIVWGDGTSTTGTISGNTVTASGPGAHTYTAPAPSTAPLTFQVQVSDSQTNPATTGSSSASIVVADYPLTGTFNTTEHGTGVFPAGTPVASFTSANSAALAGSYIASINWGDGTATDTGTTITGAGPFTVNTTNGHTFLTDGVYLITTTITDNVPGGASVNNILTYDAGVQTTTTMTSSPNPSVFGSAVTLTATVTAADSSTPTGTVTFFDGATAIGTAGLSTNTAVFSTNALATGTHSLTATYNGDASHDPSNPSTVVSQVVSTSNSSLILITSSQNPVLAGQSVTFTCVVTSGNNTTPDGQVAFYDTDTLLSSVQVTSTSAGSASAAFASAGMATGSHLIRATYSGDTNGLQNTATFDDVNQVVVGAGTAASSSSSSGSCGHGIGMVLLMLGAFLGLRLAGTRRPGGA